MSESVTVKVLGVEVSLEDFRLDVLSEEDLNLITRWELGGITDPLGQLVSWLYDQLVSWFRWVYDNLSTFVSSLISSLERSISDLISGVSSTINTIYSNIVSAINSGINSLSKSLSDFFNSLYSAISNVINTISKALSDAISTLSSYINRALGDLQRTLQGVLSAISSSIKSLSDYITSTLRTVSSALSGMYNYLVSAFPQVLSWIVDTSKWMLAQLQMYINGVVGAFQQGFAKVYNFFKDVYDKLSGAVNWVGQQFTGFINAILKFPEWFPSWFRQYIADPIVNALVRVGEAIWTALPDWLTNAITTIQSFFEQSLKTIQSFLEDPVTWVKNNIISPIVVALTELKEEIMEGVGTFFGMLVEWGQTVWSKLIQAWDWIVENVLVPVMGRLSEFVKIATQYLMNFVTTTTASLRGLISDSFTIIEDHLKRVGKKGTPQGAFATLLAQMTTDMAKAQIPYLASAVGAIASGDIAETEVQVAGSKVKLTTEWLKKLGIKLLDSLVYTNVVPLFWATAEPLSLIARQYIADWAWARTPSVSQAIDLVNRGIWKKDDLEWVVRSAGFFKEFTDVIYEEYPVIIETRASRLFELKDSPFINLGLRWYFPSISDLARFMVKDIFLKAEDFVKVMSYRGVPEHLAWTYYLLQFRYPSLDALWRFYSRVLAHEWLSEKGTTIKEMLWLEDLLEAEVKSEDVAYALAWYAKWQDYNMLSWFKGDPKAKSMQNVSDNMIVRELMADIPTRIDARWMFKWGIINDKELKGIVLARGLHPKWVDLITKGEVMNALAEERTYARTGLLNAFEYGLLTEDTLDKILSKLTTIKILDEDVDVKFLEGERKLLILRHKWDRLYDIARTLQSIYSYYIYENIADVKEVVDRYSKAIQDVANTLNISVDVDVDYVTKLFEAYAERRLTTTISRIRGWMWTFVSRVTDLAEYGVTSLQDVYNQIEQYAKTARLTSAEVELMKSLAEISFKAYKFRERKSIFRTMIKNKFSRGEITVEEAIKQLRGLGYDEEEAKALVDSWITDYVTYPSTIATLAEVVPKARILLNEFAKTHKLSETEREIWEKYIMLKPFEDEISRLITEIITDYAEGVITQDEFNRILNEIATKFGYEAQEIEIIKFIAELRRRRYARRGS